jgi:sucrose phosphorylase
MNPEHLSDALTRHLTTIYHGVDSVDSQNHQQLGDQLIELMNLQQATTEPTRYTNHWDEQDCIVISYGDSVLQPDEKPLQTLKRFLDRY